MGASYTLSKGVFYGVYGDRLYLRNVDTRKDYFFTKTVRDVLDCLSGGAERTADDVAAALAESYDAELAVLRADMDELLTQLAGEGILLPVSPPEGRPTALYEELEEFCMESRILLSLGLELTYRCNERCIHCYIDDGHDPRPELELEDYKKLLDEARAMGCLKLFLTGGEVTLKSCFLEVAEYAASLGMLLDIYTNGLDLPPETFDRLKALKPNSISYSLYGGTAQVHDAITGVNGSFERTLKSVMMTKCAGIDTFLKTVVIRENAADLAELCKLGKRIGVPVAPAYIIMDSHRGGSKARHRLGSAQEYARVMELFREAPEPERRIGPRGPNGPICGAGQCSLSVDPFGTVRPCLSLDRPVGNVRENSLRDIWESSPQLQQVRNIRFRDLCAKCDECEFLSSCTICMGRLGSDHSTVPPDLCILAEARKIAERR